MPGYMWGGICARVRARDVDYESFPTQEIHLTNSTMHQSNIPQCTICNRNVYLCTTKWCTVGYGTGEFWDLCSSMTMWWYLITPMCPEAPSYSTVTEIHSSWFHLTIQFANHLFFIPCAFGHDAWYCQNKYHYNVKNIVLDQRSNFVLVVQFPSANGVRQDGVLSLILFIAYVNTFMSRLERSDFGCFVGDENFCSMCYADDIILLAPTYASLKSMKKYVKILAKNLISPSVQIKAFAYNFLGKPISLKSTHSIYGWHSFVLG